MSKVFFNFKYRGDSKPIQYIQGYGLRCYAEPGIVCEVDIIVV